MVESSTKLNVLSYQVGIDPRVRWGRVAAGCGLLALVNAVAMVEFLLIPDEWVFALSPVFWMTVSLFIAALNFSAVMFLLSGKPARTGHGIGRGFLVTLAVAYIVLVVARCVPRNLIYTPLIPGVSGDMWQFVERMESIAQFATVVVLIVFYGAGAMYLRDLARQVARPWIFIAGVSIFAITVSNILLGVAITDHAVEGSQWGSTLMHNFRILSLTWNAGERCATMVYWVAVCSAAWRMRGRNAATSL